MNGGTPCAYPSFFALQQQTASALHVLNRLSPSRGCDYWVTSGWRSPCDWRRSCCSRLVFPVPRFRTCNHKQSLTTHVPVNNRVVVWITCGCFQTHVARACPAIYWLRILQARVAPANVRPCNHKQSLTKQPCKLPKGPSHRFVSRRLCDNPQDSLSFLYADEDASVEMKALQWKLKVLQ